MQPSQIRIIIAAAALLVVLASARTISELVIEYQWWQEMGQLPTWYSMLMYQILPTTLASIVAWLALLWAHRRGVQFAGRGDSPQEFVPVGPGDRLEWEIRSTQPIDLFYRVVPPG